MELGSGEILLILIVALLIYGGRLPEVARAIGKSVGELKRGFTETKNVVSKEIETALNVEDEKPREVQRAEPAPESLAKEDVSQAGQQPPEPPHPRHEHPN
jgi:sec-independent protein translocase protein TatA